MQALKYGVVLALLCVLSIAIVAYASTVLPPAAAFCVALCADLAVGYALLMATLPGEESKAVPAQSSIVAQTATPAKSGLAPAQKAEQRSAMPRKTERAKPATPQSTNEKPVQGNDIVARLTALPELANIDQDDIRKVVEEYRKGVRKSDIYKALHWASAKHSKIVKPVIEALLTLEQQSAA